MDNRNFGFPRSQRKRRTGFLVFRGVDTQCTAAFPSVRGDGTSWSRARTPAVRVRKLAADRLQTRYAGGAFLGDFVVLRLLVVLYCTPAHRPTMALWAQNVT